MPRPVARDLNDLCHAHEVDRPCRLWRRTLSLTLRGAGTTLTGTRWWTCGDPFGKGRPCCPSLREGGPCTSPRPLLAWKDEHRERVHARCCCRPTRMRARGCACAAADDPGHGVRRSDDVHTIVFDPDYSGVHHVR